MTPWTLAVALALCVGLLPVAAAPTPCVDGPATMGTAAALRPDGVLLTISAPRAGEAIRQVPASDAITVSADYWGPPLMAATGPRPIDEYYHLAFFLDDDASSYIGTLMLIPRCNPHILHTASTQVTFEHVLHGSHSLQVVLAGSNDVSVNPPVATSVTFVVQ